MEDWNNWGAHNKVEVNLSFPHNPIFHRSILLYESEANIPAAKPGTLRREP